MIWCWVTKTCQTTREAFTHSCQLFVHIGWVYQCCSVTIVRFRCRHSSFVSYYLCVISVKRLAPCNCAKKFGFSVCLFFSKRYTYNVVCNLWNVCNLHWCDAFKHLYVTFKLFPKRHILSSVRFALESKQSDWNLLGIFSRFLCDWLTRVSVSVCVHVCMYVCVSFDSFVYCVFWTCFFLMCLTSFF